MSLEGSGNWGKDLDGTLGKKEEYNGRVVLQWNLFNGFITTNRRRELSARLSQAKFEYDARARDIVAAVERAHAAWITGGERLAAQRDQVKANEEVVKAYEEEYRLAKRSLLDLLDAERARFDSTFQLYSLEAVHVFSAFQLLASMGVLLAEPSASSPRPTPAPTSGARRRKTSSSTSTSSPCARGGNPSPRESGEREGPIAQRWEGEGRRSEPSPSPRPSPRKRGEGVERSRCALSKGTLSPQAGRGS